MPLLPQQTHREGGGDQRCGRAYTEKVTVLAEISYPKKTQLERVPAAVSGRFDTDPVACTGSMRLALTMLEQIMFLHRQWCGSWQLKVTQKLN